MNSQIRRLFLVVIVMFAALGLAATNVQFLQAPTLNSDGRNSRTTLRSAETDRGPIIVAGTPIVSSSKVEGSKRFERTYTQGELYAPITGYYSLSLQPTGMEQAEQEVLDGESQALLVQRIKDLFAGSERRGGGIALTINPAMQEAAASALGNRRGAVVALNAKTGAVLALYSSPSFDPNPLAVFDAGSASDAFTQLNEDPLRPLSNRAIAGDTYAPGSTMKILTSVAMLEQGIAEPDTNMDSPVEVTLPGTNTTVPNAQGESCGNGNPTFREAFIRSCNTTFILASQKLKEGSLQDVAKRFGFGENLSIPLAVTPSYIPDDLNAPNLALSSIGQYDVRVTPLQMAMVAQAIADDGTMMKPYLTESIVDADAQVQSTTSPTTLSRPISADIAQKLKDMMTGSVSEPYGLARELAIGNMSIAAKSGTAEVGENNERTNGWVVGFAPADDPQIAFAVVVEGDDAQPQIFGGSAAGPIARVMLEAGLQ